MRQPHKKQMTIGSMNIEEIEFDLSCRHEIIPILMGLQSVYKNRKLLGGILDLIRQDVLGGKSEKHGTQGLYYWEILVLSAVRHGCNLDYDALQDLANNHKKLRELMGLGDMDKKQYSRSTIQGNIAKVSVETIEKISNLVISEGHNIFPRAIEKVRGDSFVVQTNIHHPTDANLILDGITKVLILVSRLALIFSIVGWRKYEYHRCLGQKSSPEVSKGLQAVKRKIKIKSSGLCIRS